LRLGRSVGTTVESLVAALQVLRVTGSGRSKGDARSPEKRPVEVVLLKHQHSRSDVQRYRAGSPSIGGLGIIATELTGFTLLSSPPPCIICSALAHIAIFAKNL